VPATLELIVYDMLFPHSVTSFLKMDKSVNIFLIRLLLYNLSSFGQCGLENIYLLGCKSLVSPIVTMYISSVNVFHILHSEYSYIVVYSCKKCGELNYLTPIAFWNVDDLNLKCKDCGTINTVTIENGELKKQV
jgi:hypothetical protein